jgi:hypothetical protein
VLKQELLAKADDAEAAKQVPFAAPTTPLSAASNAKKTTFARRFVRADRAALSKDSGPSTDQLAMPILASFEVEQSGRELRVIDGDGSVYTGYVQDSAAASAKERAAARNLSAAYLSDAKAASLQSHLQPARQPAANYSFQVIGTNRSLGERVVFTGQLSTLRNTNFVNGQVPAPGMSAPNSSRQPGEANVPIEQILGTAVIGLDRTNQINAVPARP